MNKTFKAIPLTLVGLLLTSCIPTETPTPKLNELLYNAYSDTQSLRKAANRKSNIDTRAHLDIDTAANILEALKENKAFDTYVHQDGDVALKVSAGGKLLAVLADALDSLDDAQKILGTSETNTAYFSVYKFYTAFAGILANVEKKKDSDPYTPWDTTDADTSVVVNPLYQDNGMQGHNPLSGGRMSAVIHGDSGPVTFTGSCAGMDDELTIRITNAADGTFKETTETPDQFEFTLSGSTTEWTPYLITFKQKSVYGKEGVRVVKCRTKGSWNSTTPYPGSTPLTDEQKEALANMAADLEKSDAAWATATNALEKQLLAADGTIDLETKLKNLGLLSAANQAYARVRAKRLGMNVWVSDSNIRLIGNTAGVLLDTDFAILLGSTRFLDQNPLFEALSNIHKSAHETQMGAIRNLK